MSLKIRINPFFGVLISFVNGAFFFTLYKTVYKHPFNKRYLVLVFVAL